MSPTDFEGLFRCLLDAKVDFIVVGGVAATLQGSARATFDVDVVYSRSDQNVARLVSALRPIDPYLRGAPRGLPFRFDEETVRRGLNFTLQTRLGPLDVLGEVTGGGGFDDLLPFTETVTLYGSQCRCVTLEKLIDLKRAAGRPKDNEILAELEALLQERASGNA